MVANISEDFLLICYGRSESSAQRITDFLGAITFMVHFVCFEYHRYMGFVSEKVANEVLIRAKGGWKRAEHHS